MACLFILVFLDLVALRIVSLYMNCHQEGTINARSRPSHYKKTLWLTKVSTSSTEMSSLGSNRDFRVAWQLVSLTLFTKLGQV